MYIVSGRGYVEAGGSRTVLEAGDIVVTPAGDTHTHGAEQDSALEMLTVTTGGYAFPDQP
jgi:quercetin dioxygenase-like cupin family protein